MLNMKMFQIKRQFQQVTTNFLTNNIMTIETLFNVGDEVCYLQGTKLKENVIHSIDTESKGDGTKIRYCFKDKQTIDWEFAWEDEVFESIDEFTKQLQS